jgi:dienelactone hydrolase
MALLAACAFTTAAEVKIVTDDSKGGDRRPDVQTWWTPVRPSDQPKHTYLLETAVYRPSGDGPFPLAVIVHGKASLTGDMRGIKPGYEYAARWFTERGFAVAVPLRRGYGRSEGEISDSVGTCEEFNYVETARRTAIDVEQVITFMQKQSFVRPDQTVAVGHSHGAFGLLGLAWDPPPGLTAIINFAGGTGDWRKGIWARLNSASKFCGGSKSLVESVRSLGQRNLLPQLWIYHENDHTFEPPLAIAMFNAYSQASRAPVQFMMLPPWGDNGHLAFMNGEARNWAPTVDSFLARLHIVGYRSE